MGFFHAQFLKKAPYIYRAMVCYFEATVIFIGTSTLLTILLTLEAPFSPGGDVGILIEILIIIYFIFGITINILNNIQYILIQLCVIHRGDNNNRVNFSFWFLHFFHPSKSIILFFFSFLFHNDLGNIIVILTCNTLYQVILGISCICEFGRVE